MYHMFSDNKKLFLKHVCTDFDYIGHMNDALHIVILQNPAQTCSNFSVKT